MSDFEKRYVLITAARNEENYIEYPIKSILEQTIKPEKWIIVSDRSTDSTDRIVEKYAADYGFITLLRREKTRDDIGFASKVFALHLGCQQLEGFDYGFIGHLDADVSFAPQYYEDILEKFRQNPHLGLAGGFIYEKEGDTFGSRPFNNVRSVAGGIQFYRRECYEEIGGFIPLQNGGEDWYAEVKARMNGWQVRSFPEYRVFHHKKSTSARGIFKEAFRQGLMDYALGSHPLFEILKCCGRITEKPYVLVALLRLFGFLGAYFRRENRQVSDEFIRYFRKEQLERIQQGLYHRFS
jgi:poly-beta-1,6-N-acetyl-D-glucosamine synthase